MSKLNLQTYLQQELLSKWNPTRDIVYTETSVCISQLRGNINFEEIIWWSCWFEHKIVSSRCYLSCGTVRRYVLVASRLKLVKLVVVVDKLAITSIVDHSARSTSIVDHGARSTSCLYDQTCDSATDSPANGNVPSSKTMVFRALAPCPPPRMSQDIWIPRCKPSCPWWRRWWSCWQLGRVRFQRRSPRCASPPRGSCLL